MNVVYAYNFNIFQIQPLNLVSIYQNVYSSFIVIMFGIPKQFIPKILRFQIRWKLWNVRLVVLKIRNLKKTTSKLKLSKI